MFENQVELNLYDVKHLKKKVNDIYDRYKLNIDVLEEEVEKNIEKNLLNFLDLWTNLCTYS